MNENSRGKEVMNSILDAGADEITSAGTETIRMVIQEVKEWVINRIQRKKTSSLPQTDPEVSLCMLQMDIEKSDKWINIGMEKKEIAVMWAMRKLGYTENDTQKVLDLANEAYMPREQNSDD